MIATPCTVPTVKKPREVVQEVGDIGNEGLLDEGVLFKFGKLECEVMADINGSVADTGCLVLETCCVCWEYVGGSRGEELTK